MCVTLPGFGIKVPDLDMKKLNCTDFNIIMNWNILAY